MLVSSAGCGVFGLRSFLSKPSFSDLVNQSMPIIWISLVALWPGLLSSFLRMIWCVPIPENGVVVSRLLPNPSVVCWSDDHMASAGVAMVGLGVWCFGIPVTLAARLLCLRDRQAPENFRRVRGKDAVGRWVRVCAWQAIWLFLPGSGSAVLVVGPHRQTFGHGLSASSVAVSSTGWSAFA